MGFRGLVTWGDAIDSYCERTDASFWSEPLNAVSNLSFVVAAVVAWRMARAADDRVALVLAPCAGAIGVGSFLFHTFATRWSLQADVWPIRGFVLLFVGLATVRFFGASRWLGVGASVAFVGLTVATIVVGRAVGLGLNGSIGYVSVPIAMVAMAASLARRDTAAARGMLLSSAVFVVSLGLRTVDREWCSAVPFGTHVGWHLLNGLVIGLMIAVLIRGGRAAGDDSTGRGDSSERGW